MVDSWLINGWFMVDSWLIHGWFMVDVSSGKLWYTTNWKITVIMGKSTILPWPYCQVSGLYQSTRGFGRTRSAEIFGGHWGWFLCLFWCLSQNSSTAGWWFEPLWKIWKSIGMIIPNTWETKKCSKPPTSFYSAAASEFDFESLLHHLCDHFHCIIGEILSCQASDYFS